MVFHDFIFQKFCSCSFDDFSAKSDPNSMIFDSVDSSLSPLSKNIKLPNFYPHLIVWIKFAKIPWNFPISLWIRPLFTTIPFNLCLFPKIGEFGISFDSWTCVFNNLMVLIREEPYMYTTYLIVASTGWYIYQWIEL